MVFTGRNPMSPDNVGWSPDRGDRFKKCPYEEVSDDEEIEEPLEIGFLSGDIHGKKWDETIETLDDEEMIGIRSLFDPTLQEFDYKTRIFVRCAIIYLHFQFWRTKLAGWLQILKSNPIYLATFIWLIWQLTF